MSRIERQPIDLIGDLWSRRRDLNPRPSDYKSDALPTELRRRGFSAQRGAAPLHLVRHVIPIAPSILASGFGLAHVWAGVLNRFGGGGPRYPANPGLTPIFGAVCRKLAVCPRVCPTRTRCALLLPPRRLSTLWAGGSDPRRHCSINRRCGGKLSAPDYRSIPRITAEKSSSPSLAASAALTIAALWVAGIARLACAAAARTSPKSLRMRRIGNCGV